MMSAPPYGVERSLTFVADARYQVSLPAVVELKA